MNVVFQWHFNRIIVLTCSYNGFTRETFDIVWLDKKVKNFVLWQAGKEQGITLFDMYSFDGTNIVNVKILLIFLHFHLRFR